MHTTHPNAATGYTSGYAKGRHAAEEHEPITENPFRAGSSAFKGWNDGHYDACSIRRLAIARHSAELWNGDAKAETTLSVPANTESVR